MNKKLNNHFSNQPFGEVIESNLNHFIAQCWQWNKLPIFAHLVEVTSADLRLFGCVTQITTASSDPTRKPYAYQKTEEELLQEQPQIFEMLQSTFTVQIIAYQHINTTKILYFTPPQPSKIHAFVQQATAPTIANIFATPHFLHTLFASQGNIANLEELLLALLNTMQQQNLLTKEFFSHFYQSFALLNGNDYKKTKLFFERVEHLCN